VGKAFTVSHEQRQQLRIGSAPLNRATTQCVFTGPSAQRHDDGTAEESNHVWYSLDSAVNSHYFIKKPPHTDITAWM